MDVSTFTSQRRTLATAAGEIAYTEFGAGPAAVFVHGIGTSGLLWRHAIEMLSDTTRCIAIDLPAHGGTPARDDLSVAGFAQVVADLADGLGLGRLDLVGNDTGGAVTQIYAAHHPERLRSLVLTNCDTEDNMPPAVFAPTVEAATRGELAPLLPVLAADPSAARSSPLAGGYEHPEKIGDDVWRAYLEPALGTPERARHFERMLAAVDSADLTAVHGALRALQVPTLLAWGTDDAAFGLPFAYQLLELIPGAQEVAEIDGGKLFFPEERPEDLVVHLRRWWGR
jgi:pimeloyl-ACP methyl ester carboxylesterase